MFRVIKKAGKTVQAYCLGEDHQMIRELIESGKIEKLDDDTYVVWSQEAVNGKKKGEIAYRGDFIKLDSSGAPYPNRRDFFVENHRHLSGDDYEQIRKPLYAWKDGEDDCEEIEFLKKHKGLVIDRDHPEKFYSAPLYGTLLCADSQAVVIFYNIDREEQQIKDIDFNFIEHGEFERTYRVIEEEL
ncbi:MAG: hypothetical protein MR543_01740 [Robinsoniella sp.]|nr:hypothetical protein [Robinsoniella sp.]